MKARAAAHCVTAGGAARAPDELKTREAETGVNRYTSPPHTGTRYPVMRYRSHESRTLTLDQVKKPVNFGPHFLVNESETR